MKKIESFLWKHSFSLKSLIALLWVLWAVQLFFPLKEILVEDMKYLRNRDVEKEIQDSLKLQEFADEKLKKANAGRISYSPQRYFKDLKEIEERRNSPDVFFPQYEVDHLIQLVMDNIKKGYYKWQEFEEARSYYQQKEESSGGKRTISGFENVRWQGVLPWLIAFYQRSILLAFFLYLIRMAQREKNILGTILAEKKKFILATLAWPFFIHKYPFNVVREIRVEAELRRLKGLFRVFSVKEARLVKEVANSSYYKEWLFDFHLQNRGSFGRGLFVALMATLILHLFFPSNLRASETRIRGPVLMLCQGESQTTIVQDLTDSDDDQQVEQWGIPPAVESFMPLLLIVIVKFFKSIWYSREPDSIDRVPRISLFGVVLNFINQTEKGEKDEYGQKDDLLWCFTGWSSRNCFC